MWRAQEVVGEGGEVLDMSEGVFAEALVDYPGMELAWLQLLWEAQQAEAGSAPRAAAARRCCCRRCRGSAPRRAAPWGVLGLTVALRSLGKPFNIV